MHKPSVPLIAATLLLALTANLRADPPSLPHLHAGLLLDYTWVASTAPGESYIEDAQGGWIDATPGDTTANEGYSSSGGLSQITIAHMDRNDVILSSLVLYDATPMGFKQFSPDFENRHGFVVPLNKDPELAVDPALLALLEKTPPKDVQITTTTWMYQNQPIKVYRVQKNADGLYLDHVYDFTTGICIHAASVGDSEGQTGHLNGVKWNQEKGTLRSQISLMSARDLDIPWSHEAAPDWVAHISALHFQGQTHAGQGFGQINTPSLVDLTIAKRGQGWLNWNTTLSLPYRGHMIPMASKVPIFACGNDQFFGLWVPPAALGRLQTGQVLDRDDFTGIQTTVDGADANSVTISQGNSVAQASRTYDRTSGMVIGMTYQSQFAHSRTDLRLQSQE